MIESETPHRIEIDVECNFVDEQSAPELSKFVFAYTVTVRNVGQIAAKLLSRHWIITDCNGKVQEVRGSGVVGEQPHVKPGEGFRYTSAAMIETPVGSMHGSYQMVTDDGVEFDAEIAPFSLSNIQYLH